MVSPDAWEVAQWAMERPGNKTIQFALGNYGSNPERNEGWHRYFREHQPPTLVAWGKGDRVFSAAGAQAYPRDHRAGDCAQEAEHAVRCFLGLAGVTTMLIAQGALPYSRSVAIVLFVLGSAFMLGFALWRTGRLWRGGREASATKPVLYLPTVAGGVCGTTAAALGWRD